MEWVYLGCTRQRVMYMMCAGTMTAYTAERNAFGPRRDIGPETIHGCSRRPSGAAHNRPRVEVRLRQQSLTLVCRLFEDMAVVLSIPWMF